MHIRGALWCVEPECESECENEGGGGGGGSLCMCVSVRACVCVCVFDVMFVHSVVAMAPSLTPDARENCVPIPFWPTESGR